MRSNSEETFSKIFKAFSRNKHLKFGLPFFAFLGLGFFGLREFNTVRYDFRNTKSMDRIEMQKLGIKMRDNPMTIEECYEEIEDLDTENWKNIRGPKFLFDNEEEVKNYHWGKKGRSSLVAKFSSANSSVVPDDDTPYAEIWMGTHPNGSSLLKITKTELSEHINLNRNELGDEVINNFGIQLPFLMKILSVEKPLSIQVHPTKCKAEEMFQKFSDIYKDNNHKPELAVALAQCELLLAFRPWESIRNFLKSIPEFKMLIDEKILNECFKVDVKDGACSEILRVCFQDFIKSDEKLVASAIEKLLERSKTLNPDEKKNQLIFLIEKLNNLFPNDIGVLCVYFLNHMVLEPGDIVYIAPGMPHAYLSGEYLECMANSDNVVRAGLTPKFRDVQMLSNIVSYEVLDPFTVKLKPMLESPFQEIISPPVKDFAVGRIQIPGKTECQLKKRESASILCVLKGKGKMDSLDLAFGKVFYIPAETEISIHSEEDLLMFQAFCNEKKFYTLTELGKDS